MSVFGKDVAHDDLENYEPSEAFKKQKDTRVIKHLHYPWLVEAPNPAMVDGPPVLKERVAKQGDTVTIEELGPLALERGERLGSFYTDEELARPKQGAAAMPVDVMGESEPASNFSEWGVAELAEYIEKNKPNVDDTVAMSQGDPEAAKRVLEAEGIATGGDSRSGVVNGLTKVIGDAQ